MRAGHREEADVSSVIELGSLQIGVESSDCRARSFAIRIGELTSHTEKRPGQGGKPHTHLGKLADQLG